MTRLRKPSCWLWIAAVSTGLVAFLFFLWTRPDPQLMHTFSVGGPIYSVAIDSRTSVIASSGRDDIVRLWRISDQALLHTLEAYPCVTSNIVFHPNGQQIAVGYGNGAVLLWDVATGEVARTLRDIQPLPPDKSNRCTAEDGNDIRKVLVIAFSPDGTLVAISGLAQPTSIIDTVTGSLRHELQTPPSVIWHLVFSPDGTLLISSGVVDNTINVWNIKTGQLEMVLEASDGRYSIRALAFVEDGEQLLVGQSGGSVVETWSFSEGEIIDTQSVLDFTSGVWEFSPSGNLFAAGGQASHGFFKNSGLPVPGGRADPTIYLGSLDTPDQHIRLRGHADRITSLAFSTDGDLLVSGSRDGTVRLWRVPTFAE